MADRLQHRGPDDAGCWSDMAHGVAMAHRRLAVVGPGLGSRQPMRSPCGRYTLVFNGEIYETRPLRRRAESGAGGWRWHGDSDTEVLLATLIQQGVDVALGHLEGMFAFALWDGHRSELTLARDRIGIKPLYWGRESGNLLFASQLGAFRAFPDFRPKLDRKALSAYMRYGCVPNPQCIYRGFHQVEPGTALTFSDPESAPRTHRYGSLPEIARRSQSRLLEGDDTQVTDEVEQVFDRAVRRRMVADVPLGAFLSGGIDSSLVVASMQAQSGRPIRTFCLGVDHRDYDESRWASQVAAHLGTDHSEMMVTERQIVDVIQTLPEVFDEPFADSSQIPMQLVSQFAREHVTVCLSGDGGDELFAGYNRHLWVPRIWRAIGGVPPALRRRLSQGLERVGIEGFGALLSRLGSVLPGSLEVRAPAAKLQKIVETLGAESAEDLHRLLQSHWKHPESLVLGVDADDELAVDDTGLGAVEKMLLRDMLTYLPNDILTKVDRASMAVGLEARVPMLDRDLVELAWRVPTRFKIRGDKTKWVLREMLSRRVPPSLTERPKSGFGVPLGDLLRGPLRDWAENLLDPKSIREQGFLNADLVSQTWAQHRAGRSLEHPLWTVLMFQAWLGHQQLG